MKPAARATPALRLYAATTWLLALVAVVWAARETAHAVALPPGGLVAALSLIAFVAVAGTMPIALTPKVKVHVGTSPMFAAILLFPVPIAAAIGLAGSVLSHAYLQRQRRRTTFDMVFNGGRTVLQIAMAGMLFHVLAGGSLWPATGDTSNLLLAVVVGGVAYYAINAATVYGAVAITLHQDPAVLWLASIGVEAPQQAALLLFGFITALVASAYPVLALAMILPVAVVHYSLRTSMAMRAQTQGAVEAMADAIDVRAHGAYGHSRRVAELSAALARRMGLSGDEVELIRRAARVHDIGKVGVPDAILQKRGPLDAEELQAIRRHPEQGAEILGGFPEYQRCRPLVRMHHERPDGAGYPDGKFSSEIPLGAAIIAVAEAFDALTSERPYRAAVTPAEAAAELRVGAGSAWNAAVVRALLADRQLVESAEPARTSPAAQP